jgi:uncharacterized damage-inducible protein DinB
MSPDAALAERFIEQCRRYLGGEYRVKLRAAVAAVPEDKLWARANGSSNSVGNLLLHLAGNIRQWIVSGVGGAPDVRRRSEEFDADGGQTAPELLAALEATLDEVDAALASLPAGALLEARTIQGRELIVVDAVFHVVEHFSYHEPRVCDDAPFRTEVSYGPSTLSEDSGSGRRHHGAVG